MFVSQLNMAALGSRRAKRQPAAGAAAAANRCAVRQCAWQPTAGPGASSAAAATRAAFYSTGAGAFIAALGNWQKKPWARLAPGTCLAAGKCLGTADSPAPGCALFMLGDGAGRVPTSRMAAALPLPNMAPPFFALAEIPCPSRTHISSTPPSHSTTNYI